MKAILGNIISIDYKNGKFSLYDKLEPHMTQGWHCVPVKFQSRQILIPLKVKVNPQTIISGDALMDIGSGSGITFTSPVASAHSLENIEWKEQFETGGLGGKSAGYTIPVESVDINGIPIDLESVQYRQTRTAHLPPPDMQQMSETKYGPNSTSSLTWQLGKCT